MYISRNLRLDNQVENDILSADAHLQNDLELSVILSFNRVLKPDIYICRIYSFLTEDNFCLKQFIQTFACCLTSFAYHTILFKYVTFLNPFNLLRLLLTNTEDTVVLCLRELTLYELNSLNN